MQLGSSDQSFRNDTIQVLKDFNQQPLSQHKLKKENSL